MAYLKYFPIFCIGFFFIISPQALGLNWWSTDDSDLWILDQQSLSDLKQQRPDQLSINIPYKGQILEGFEIQILSVSQQQYLQTLPVFTYKILPRLIEHETLGDIAIHSGRLTIYENQIKVALTINQTKVYVQETEPSMYRSIIREPPRDISNTLNQALYKPIHNHNHFQCHTEATHISLEGNISYRAKSYSNTDHYQDYSLRASDPSQKLYTYRLALAATSSYNDRVGFGNKALTYAEMINAVNRVNEIFEKDFSVRLKLVSGPELISTNSNDYNEDNILEMMSQNQQRIDSLIGFGNYDIGHVLGVRGGGVAVLSSACSSRKASGVSGISSPVSTIFYTDYLAHELAHQLSAMHTFNADGIDSGFCQGNRQENSAYEVGSGSTIMSYAGLCSAQNLQSSSNNYFHADSIQRVRLFNAQKSQTNCIREEHINNAPPEIYMDNAYIIPAGTPFVLDAEAQDLDDDNNLVRFTWEQFDLGPESKSVEELYIDNGSGPIIRSELPSRDSKRYIPSYQDVLRNDYNRQKGVRLPSTDRDMNFILTVRSGEYGLSQAPLKVISRREPHPFSLVQPSGYVKLAAGEETLISWITANTNNAPVNCPKVTISLSSDEGQSFPYILSESSPNIGHAKVALPNLQTNLARVKIQCSDNIFYSISKANFSIEPTSKALVSINSSTDEIEEGSTNDTPNSVRYTVSLNQLLNIPITLTYKIENAGKSFSELGIIDSTMVDGDDFSENDSLPSGSVTIAAGETSANFTLKIHPDDKEEWDEYFQVVLNMHSQVGFSVHHALNKIISDEVISTYEDLRSEGQMDSGMISNSRQSSGQISYALLLLLFSCLKKSIFKK